MPPVVSFSFSILLARGTLTVGVHGHTRGGQELSSSTGDARRVERVVVLAGRVAGDAFHTALVVAQVMRGEQTRGTAGEAVGGGWRGRQIGLREVEPGGAPASQVFVKTSRTHEGAGIGSIRPSHAKARTPRCRQHEKCGGGQSTHCHWHLSQGAPEDTAGSVAGVSTVATARSDDSVVDRGGSKVRRCLWLRRLRERMRQSCSSPASFHPREASQSTQGRCRA